jgi:dTDP-4-dehydrorhamnose 3,5-epimerase
MLFAETELKGAYIIKPQRTEDERGFFARTFCKKEFAEHGLNALIAQCNISYNRKKGTFRGMHFQAPPFEEEKIVSCVQGALLDYIVDLRTDSPTFKHWIEVELSAENGHSLYIPKSFAHGFLTLANDTCVSYQMTQFYSPDHARGFRFDDPAFNIQFPFEIVTLSVRDRNYPDFYPLPVTELT